MLLLFVEVEGKPQIWAGGYAYNGILGTGDETNQCELKVVNYDHENIVFKDARFGNDHILAITTNGELYGWGQNSSKQLGLPEAKIYYAPTKVPYFENYVVHEIRCGKYFSIVKASPKDNLEKTMIFNIGNVQGISSDGKTEEGILHIERFDDSNFKIMEAGSTITIFAYDGESKASANVGVHHGYTCEITKQCPIEGTMHFYKREDGNWIFLSKEGYEQAKNSLPQICYATKYYIEDIQSKNWPELKPKEILEDTKAEFEPSYLSNVNVSGESIKPMAETNEEGIFERESHDINPLIFYRITKPIKDGASLPELKLEDYHKKTDMFGIRIEADPDYSFQKNDMIIGLEYDKYLSMQDRIKLFDEKYDAELLKQIENNLTVMQQNFIECPFVFLMAAELEFEAPGLRALPTENVDARIKSLVMLNQYLLKSLPFLCFEEGIIHVDDNGKTKLQEESLTASFMMGKKYALESVKKGYIKLIADGLGTEYAGDYIDLELATIKDKIKEGK
jgi:hypothetical protein